MVTYIKAIRKMEIVNKQTILLGLLASLVSKVAAAPLGANGEGIIPGEQDFFVIEWAAGAGGWVAEALLVPSSSSPQAYLIWFGGFFLTIYGFYRAVSNFDEKVGGWIDDEKENFLVGFLLAMIFIGGANFLGFIQGVWMLLGVGVTLTIIVAILYGGLWFGGLFTNLGIRLEGSRAGTAVRGGINYAQNNTWGPFTNNPNNFPDDVWNEYENKPRCVNGHINRTANAGGGNCWVCGDNVP